MRPAELEIIPGVGIPPLRFGMTVAQTLSALAVLGEVRDITAPGGAPAWRVTDSNEALDLHVNCRADGRLFTIEAWRPRAQPVAVPVRLQGVDIFGQRAESVIDALREVGVPVADDDPFYPTAYEDQVRFDRTGGEDVDDQGLSYWFESAMIVPAGYATLYTNVVLPDID